MKIKLKELALIIKDLEEKLQLPVYLVGGAVRDFLLGNEIKDFDFTTPALPDEVEMAIRKFGKKPYTVGKKFGTVAFRHDLNNLSLIKKPQIVEITTFRKEIYAPGDRKPEVIYSDKIELDLSRRDFTINSLAIDSEGKIIDPFGGQNHLSLKIIKAVGSPKERLKEDPLRILRAIRFAGSLGFEIEAKTLKQIIENRFSLLGISKERWTGEMDKILQIPDPTKSLEYMMETEVMQVILPEIRIQKGFDQNSPYHDFDLWTHTKKVVAKTPFNNLNLRWAALLHDIAKPATKIKNSKNYSNYIGHDLIGAEMVSKVLNYLKFSKDRQNVIKNIVLNHLKPESELKSFDDAGKKA